jgi:hypothetical protein
LHNDSASRAILWRKWKKAGLNGYSFLSSVTESKAAKAIKLIKDNNRPNMQTFIADAKLSIIKKP